MNSPVTAAGFFVFKQLQNGALFLIIRSKRDGFWGFPKGHTDEGEDMPEAARRELAEETGITEFKKIDGFEETIKYDVHGNPKTVTYFLAEAVEDAEITLSNEHDQYRWLKPPDVEKYVIFPNLRRAFAKAAAHPAARK